MLEITASELPRISPRWSAARGRKGFTSKGERRNSDLGLGGALVSSGHDPFTSPA